MDAKLTLKLKKSVIEKAKRYAASNQKSLSRMIEAYLESITADKNQESKEEIEISPFVKSLSTGTSIPNNIDYKQEYSNHQSDKYK